MNLETILFEYFNKTVKYMRVQPINLGGTAASGGGAGGPPGGFKGFLPQTRVAYDLTEAETFITASGASLVDNLNHIRARISGVEDDLVTISGIAASGIGGITVLDDGIIVVEDTITKINFGDGLIVVASGTDYVTVNATGSGGGATALSELTDVNIPSPSDGEVLTYSGGEWVAQNRRYRQFTYIVSGGDFSFVKDINGEPVLALQNLE